MQIINEPQAVNADANLHVTFYKEPVLKEFESEQQGRPIYEERLLVKIHPPGEMFNIVVREATQWDFRRFPAQYAAYLNSEQHEVHGTPVDQWPALNRAQVEELKGVKFYTVEQLAAASDQQLASIGMGGMGLRSKAQAYLAAAKDTALVQRQAAELERRDNEIAELKRQMAQIAAQMEKRPPGRPRNPVPAESSEAA